TRAAIGPALHVHGDQEAFEAEVGDRICLEEVADLSDRVRGGDQIFLPRRVDAIEGRRDRRRTADAHWNFFLAGCAHHADDLAAGRAAHDRIVDENHALTTEDAAHRIQLYLHAEVSNGRLRLDERAADVVITNEAHAQRDAGFVRVPHRRTDTRVGY